MNLSDLFVSSNSPAALEQALLGILLAFVLGQALAWSYIYTHSGLSYSRNFVQSLVILTVLLSIGMMVIGNSFAIAFGLIGALSVIRFRNILKDTRDTSFVFASLVIGMASGTGAVSLAITGTVAVCAIILYLHWVGFGSRFSGDGFVRFHFLAGEGGYGRLQDVLGRYCQKSHLVSQRFSHDDAEEFSYRLSMRDVTKAGDFVQSLRDLEGVSHVAFAVQEDEAEV